MTTVKNPTAESLEEKGLWRRAATCWLTVMQRCHTAEEQDWVRIRRNYCLSRIKRAGNLRSATPVCVNYAGSEPFYNVLKNNN